jgi:hypothetical protein
MGAVGLLLGIPAGVIVGRLVWRQVAESIGISSAMSVPMAALLLLIPVGLLLINLIAIFPARGVATSRPGVALREE